jgi:hypothetical protein
MKKLLLIFALALVAVFTAGMAEAYVPNYAPCAGCIGYGYASYGSHPVNQNYGGYYPPYASQPARIGGWFGQNSAQLIGLRPGFYDSPNMNYYNRYAVTSTYYPRGPYGRAYVNPRTGGYFGQGYTSNLRPGMPVYTGGKTYAAPNYYFSGPM